MLTEYEAGMLTNQKAAEAGRPLARVPSSRNRDLSVEETSRLIAHARRFRSEYLRAGIRHLALWIVRRWSGARVRGESLASRVAENVPNAQAKPPGNRLRPAA